MRDKVSNRASHQDKVKVLLVGYLKLGLGQAALIGIKWSSRDVGVESKRHRFREVFLSFG